MSTAELGRRLVGEVETVMGFSEVGGRRCCAGTASDGEV